MKNILILVVLLSALTSCIVKRPGHGGIDTWDATNNVKTIYTPYYKKKVSGTGAVFQAGATAAGALGGITLKPTTFYDGNNQSTSNTVVNGVIGAAVGYGITSLAYVMMGQRKREDVNNHNDFPQWLRKYNNNLLKSNYVYTGFNTGNGYLVLPDDKETQNNYKVRSVTDAAMFKNAFPYSTRNSVFETQAASLVSNIYDARLFLSFYPNSTYSGMVKQKLQQLAAEEAARIAAMRQAEREAYEKAQANSWIKIGVGALIVGGVAALIAYALKPDSPNESPSTSDNSNNVSNNSSAFIPCATRTNNSTDLYVLSIGTDEDVLVDKDAIALSQTIKKGCGKKELFGNIYTITLAGNNATKDKILTAFNEIRQKTNKDDIFLLFFSGHGGTDRSTYVFQTHKSENLYITVDEIVDGLEADNCKTILWFNSCYAGQVSNNFRDGITKYIQNKVCPNVSILMSSAAHEKSYVDMQNGLSYFTKALIDGLNGAADQVPKNRIISLRELEEYVIKAVPQRNPQQHPQKLKEGREELKTRLSTY